MTFTQHTSLKRLVAFALTATFLLPPGTILTSAAQAQDPAPVAPASPSASAAVIRFPTAPMQATRIKSVLLFPFANTMPAGASNSGFDPDIVGAQVEEAVKMRLNTIGRYQASSFSPRLPQIQRALSEPSATGQGVTENDLVPPYTNGATAQRITDEVGTDGYLLGTVEALSQDPKTRSVNLTVSATLYNTTTGAPVKVLAYTGHGVSFNAADDPNTLLQSAVNDAAGHVVSALNAQAAPQRQAAAPADVKHGKKNHIGSILIGVLVAVGIGLAIASGHHHHNGGGGGGGTTTTTTTTTTTGTGIPAPPNLGQGTIGTGTGTTGGTILPPGAPST